MVVILSRPQCANGALPFIVTGTSQITVAHRWSDGGNISIVPGYRSGSQSSLKFDNHLNLITNKAPKYILLGTNVYMAVLAHIKRIVIVIIIADIVSVVTVIVMVVIIDIVFFTLSWMLSTLLALCEGNHQSSVTLLSKAVELLGLLLLSPSLLRTSLLLVHWKQCLLLISFGKCVRFITTGKHRVYQYNPCWWMCFALTKCCSKSVKTSVNLTPVLKWSSSCICILWKRISVMVCKKIGIS